LVKILPKSWRSLYVQAVKINSWKQLHCNLQSPFTLAGFEQTNFWWQR
jgi:hypothetical protein